MTTKVASILAEIGIDSSKFSSGASNVKNASGGIIESLKSIGGAMGIVDSSGGKLQTWATQFGNAGKQAGLTDKEILKMTVSTGAFSEEQQVAMYSQIAMTNKSKELAAAVANGSMTTRDAGKAWKDFAQTQLPPAMSASQGLLNVIMKFGPAIALMGIMKMAQWMKEAEKAANEANIVTAKQEAILKATGYAANTTSAELAAMATELSQLTGIDDEAVASAQSLLLTFRNIGRTELPRATQAVIDMSTTFGGLESSSIQLGKALNDPIKGVTALQRVGIQFNDDQRRMIQGFMDTNQIAKAQAIILEEVEKQVGGTAAAMEDASDGSNRLKVSAENLSEAYGQSLVPAQRQWNKLLADTFDALAKNISETNTWNAQLEKTAREMGYSTSEVYSYTSHMAAVPKALIEATQTAIENNAVMDERNRILRDQGYVVDEVTGAISLSTEATQVNEEAMTKANESTLRGIEQWQSMEESFTARLEDLYTTRGELEARLTELRAAGYKENSAEIQGVIAKIQENDAAVQKNAEEHELATKKIILGYIEQKFAADGVLTDDETNWLIAKGVEWGIYKEDVIEMYRAAMAEADAFAATRAAAEQDNTILVDYIVTNYVPPPVYSGYASGGPASGLSLVGEQGPELVNLPAGSFVNNANTTERMLSGESNNAPDSALLDAVSSLMASNRALPAAIARALRQNEKHTR